MLVIGVQKGGSLHMWKDYMEVETVLDLHCSPTALEYLRTAVAEPTILAFVSAV